MRWLRRVGIIQGWDIISILSLQKIQDTTTFVNVAIRQLIGWDMIFLNQVQHCYRRLCVKRKQMYVENLVGGLQKGLYREMMQSWTTNTRKIMKCMIWNSWLIGWELKRNNVERERGKNVYKSVTRWRSDDLNAQDQFYFSFKRQISLI